MEFENWQPPTAPRAMRMNCTENTKTAVSPSEELAFRFKSVTCEDTDYSDQSTYRGAGLDVQTIKASIGDQVDLVSDADSTTTSIHNYDSSEVDKSPTTFSSPSNSPEAGKGKGKDISAPQLPRRYSNMSWVSTEQKFRHEYEKIMANAGHIGLALSPFLPQSEAEYARLLADIKSAQKAKLDRALEAEMNAKHHRAYKFLPVIDEAGALVVKCIVVYSARSSDENSQSEPTQVTDPAQKKTRDVVAAIKKEIAKALVSGNAHHKASEGEKVSAAEAATDVGDGKEMINGQVEATRVRRLGDNLMNEHLQAMVRTRNSIDSNYDNSTKLPTQESGTVGITLTQGAIAQNLQNGTGLVCTCPRPNESWKCPPGIATWGTSANNAFTYYQGMQGQDGHGGNKEDAPRTQRRHRLYEKLCELAKISAERRARKKENENGNISSSSNGNDNPQKPTSNSAPKTTTMFLTSPYSPAINPNAPMPPKPTVEPALGGHVFVDGLSTVLALPTCYQSNPVWNTAYMTPSEVVEWPTVADIAAESKGSIPAMGRGRSRPLPVPRRNVLDPRKAADGTNLHLNKEMLAGGACVHIPWSMRESVGERWDLHPELRQLEKNKGSASQAEEISLEEAPSCIVELLATIDRQLKEDY